MTPAELVRRGRNDALKIARMTREDAQQLTAVFLQVASLQARDTLRALRGRLAARARRRR